MDRKLEESWEECAKTDVKLIKIYEDAGLEPSQAALFVACRTIGGCIESMGKAGAETNRRMVNEMLAGVSAENDRIRGEPEL